MRTSTVTGYAHRVLVIPVLGLLLAVSASEGAHGQAPNTLARAYMMTPKVGMGPEFEMALGEHAAWRKEHEDPWSWAVWQVVQGSSLGSYLVRSPGHNWADFDEYDAGFGIEGTAHFQATVAPLLESISAMTTASDTTNRRLLPDGRPVNLVQFLTYHLKPGQVDRFREIAIQFHQAIVEQDFPLYYVFISPVVGSPDLQTSVVLIYDTWTAFQLPERPFADVITEVYGREDGAALIERFNETHTRVESVVLRSRPDLSVTRAPE